MTREELSIAVWELVDQHSEEMSQQEYLNLLKDIAFDAAMRAQAVEDDLDAEAAGEDDETDEE